MGCALSSGFQSLVRHIVLLLQQFHLQEVVSLTVICSSSCWRFSNSGKEGSWSRDLVGTCHASCRAPSSSTQLDNPALPFSCAHPLLPLGRRVREHLGRAFSPFLKTARSWTVKYTLFVRLEKKQHLPPVVQNIILKKYQYSIVWVTVQERYA